MAFAINNSLDYGAIKELFDRLGFVHIPSMLPDREARRLHKTLVEDTPWNFVFHDGDKHVDMSTRQIADMGKDELGRLQRVIYERASKGFQYSYHNYPIYDAVASGQNEGHPLHELYSWMNSDEFLAFARAVTGFDDISFVDAQATRYGPGQFLTMHDDELEGKNRRAAYVFNFTPDWRPDWGGYLQFFDNLGNVRAGFAPAWNALNILAVPQRHNVSFVTPFASANRLSVTGWFRYGDAE